MTNVQNSLGLFHPKWHQARDDQIQYCGDKPLNTISEDEVVLASWKINQEIVTLKIDTKGNLIAYPSSDKMKPITQMWIKGIPSELKAHPRALKSYLGKTYVRLGSIGASEATLHIMPRLSGGMVTAAGTGLSAFSSTMGFFTSGNYVRLANAVGNQAQTVLRIAGQECRATVETAEMATANTITRARDALGQSISRAKNATEEVIRTARREVDGAVAGLGIEMRQSAKIMELQVEKALREASRTADVVYAKAGIEARKTLQSAGNEARETTILASQELSANIRIASDETSRMIEKCRTETQAIIEESRCQALAVIQQGGADVRGNINQIIDHGIKQIEEYTNRTINEAGDRIENLVRQIATEINTIILNAGEQGRLLLRDTGEEFQYRANNVLACAASQGQIMIEAAGVRGSLMIQEANQMVRCRLHEMPKIAGLVAAQIARNFAHELKRALFGVREVDGIINSLMNLFQTPVETDIQAILKFVAEQHQISPVQKALLYRTLIQVMNDPAIPEKQRFSAFVLIGANACGDADLMQIHRFCRFVLSQRHLSDDIISSIPGDAQEIVRQRRENAMDVFIVQEAIPEFEAEPPAALALELQEQQEREEQLARENERENDQLRLREMQVRLESSENQNNQLRSELESVRAQLQSTPQLSIEDLSEEITHLREQLEQQSKLVEQLKRELVFVK